MSTRARSERAHLSRRNFLTAAAPAGVLPIVLDACSSGGSKSSSSSGGSSPTGTISFWDGEVGTGELNTQAKKLTEAWTDGKITGSYNLMTGNDYEIIEAALAANKGPTVAGGYAYQAFQFADQGDILYSDNVVATMQKNGQYADYLPGLFDQLKNSKGYVAIPWGVDTRALWYNKTLLDKAGAAVPTDWNSFIAACKALKKIGVYGYVTAANSSNSAYGTHTLATFMINNGGGMFNESGEADTLYEPNVEAIDFLLEMSKDKYIDPGSVSYIDTDVYTELKAGRAGMALANATIPQETGGTPTNTPFAVMSPIKSPSGKTGTIQYLKNYQMYTKTPSTAASEKFLLWWNEQFVGSKGFYAQGITAAVPVRKSAIALPQVQADPNLVKIIKEWVPVAKPESARYGHIFSGLATVDNGTPMVQCIQSILQGNTTAKAALTTLQNGISQYGASYKA
jgi:multiple sugar transport system substrate-binding protein